MNRIDEDLDEVTLPQRPRRTEERDEIRSSLREDRIERGVPEREFTLSTGTVLALFFGLALVCAVFFGFGYNMGRKSAVATTAAATAASDISSATTTELTATKPAAGSPAAQQIPAYQGQSSAAEATGRTPATSPSKPTNTVSPRGDTVTVPLTESTSTKTKPPAADDPDGKIVETPQASSMAQKPATSAGGTAYVQVAAVSHPEDANSVVSALKRRGYSVFTRTSDTDKLIHVQLGPFSTKKDAEAMRLRLQGDGYNAILK